MKLCGVWQTCGCSYAPQHTANLIDATHHKLFCSCARFYMQTNVCTLHCRQVTCAVSLARGQLSCLWLDHPWLPVSDTEAGTDGLAITPRWPIGTPAVTLITPSRNHCFSIGELSFLELCYANPWLGSKGSMVQWLNIDQQARVTLRSKLSCQSVPFSSNVSHQDQRQNSDQF